MLLMNHEGLDLPRHQERPFQVNVHDCIPVAVGHFKKKIVPDDACIVHKDVDPSEALNCLSHCFLHILVSGYIRDPCKRFIPLCPFKHQS